jgi:hypothetical protein
LYEGVHSGQNRPQIEKESTMSDDTQLKAIYSWEAAYNAAVLETDEAAMPLRVYDALAAIEQRQLSPIEEDSEENRALRAATLALQTLRVERVNGFEGRNSTSDES